MIGTALPRLDIPGKVSGGASYVQDLKMPGMVHARVVLPPAYDAQLQAATKPRHGPRRALSASMRDGNLLAVVAHREWQAVQAQRALSAGCRWGQGRALPQPEQVSTQLKQIATEGIVIADARTPLAAPTKTLTPPTPERYLMHGSIGPSCAVGHMQDGVLTIWTHSQSVYPLRDALAEMLSMPKDKIRCIHVEGSGCYGHNGADDVAAHTTF